MKKILLFLLCVSLGVQSKSLDMLSAFNTYAQQFQEYPHYTNKNKLDPNYTAYYQNYSNSRMMKWFYSVASRLGFFEVEHKWPVREFEHVLKTLIASREKENLKGIFIQKIIPHADTRFVVWGDLQGAFHSLIRDLKELERLKIINDMLEIAPNYYFIFNGDLISRSAYSLETLTLVMMLMQKNPTQVFYIRGNHETECNWHDYGLKRELKIKARGLDTEKIPFDSLVRNFFNTLPIALFLEGTDKQTKKKAFVRISHYTVSEEPLLDEDNFSEFLFAKQTDPIAQHYPKMRTVDPEKFADIKAVITGISRSMHYEPTDGLSLLIPERGATTWTQLSSPTSVYQELYSFFNDAFTILKTKKWINDWTLTLYTHDVRKKDGFNTKSFHLMSGRPLSSEDQILNIKELVVGSINDVTKSTSTLGKSLREGLALRINESNIQGEVPGKYIRIVFLDDEYTPYKTVKAMETLKKKYGTDTILTTLGTPTQEALLSYIKNGSVSVLFGYSGATKFRQPDLTNTVHYRTSYEREAYVLVEYAVKELKMKRFALVYQDDAFGKALRDGARVALHEFDCEWVEASYPRNTLHMEPAVKAIEGFDPEVIMLFGTRAPSYALIQLLGIPYVANKILMGGSFLTDAFRDMIEPRGLNLIITRVVPDPKGELAISKEYRENAFKKDPKALLSVDTFEGYINGSLFIEALKSIKGSANKEKLMNYFHAMKNKKFKGLELQYDPESQELSKNRNVWIDDGVRWKLLSGKNWHHDQSKALGPKNKTETRTSASLYLPDKTQYTFNQLVQNLLIPQTIESLLGLDYVCSIKTDSDASCLGSGGISWR